MRRLGFFCKIITLDTGYGSCSPSAVMGKTPLCVKVWQSNESSQENSTLHESLGMGCELHFSLKKQSWIMQFSATISFFIQKIVLLLLNTIIFLYFIQFCCHCCNTFNMTVFCLLHTCYILILIISEKLWFWACKMWTVLRLSHSLFMTTFIFPVFFESKTAKGACTIAVGAYS